MYVYIYIHTHTYIYYVYIHTHTHIYVYIYITSICGDSLAGYQQAMTSKQWGDRVETPLRPLKMGISHSNQLEKRTWTTDGRTTGNLTLDGFQHDSLLLGVFWDWTGLSHPPTKMPLELSTGNGSTHHEEQRSDFLTFQDETNRLKRAPPTNWRWMIATFGWK